MEIKYTGKMEKDAEAKGNSRQLNCLELFRLRLGWRWLAACKREHS